MLGETILGLRESVIVTTIYSNFKALELSNVETRTVARSCLPCVVAFGPYLVWADRPKLYTNTLSIIPMALIGLASNDQSRLCELEWSVGLVCLVALSCIIGVAISPSQSMHSCGNSRRQATPLGILTLLLTLFPCLLRGKRVAQQSQVRRAPRIERCSDCLRCRQGKCA